jgi:hypothetical protein
VKIYASEEEHMKRKVITKEEQPMKEQIEEMAGIIEKNTFKNCEEVPLNIREIVDNLCIANVPSCGSCKAARALIKEGYRKQSENTVEVVRCKDCEYWTEVSFDAITELHWGECRKPLGDYRYCETAEHVFCSYGEAKMKGGAE